MLSTGHKVVLSCQSPYIFHISYWYIQGNVNLQSKIASFTGTHKNVSALIQGPSVNFLYSSCHPIRHHILHRHLPHHCKHSGRVHPLHHSKSKGLCMAIHFCGTGIGCLRTAWCIRIWLAELWPLVLAAALSLLETIWCHFSPTHSFQETECQGLPQHRCPKQ